MSSPAHRRLVAIAVVAAAAWLAARVWPTAGFAGEASAAIETRTVADEHGDRITLVRPRLDGRVLGWFALDTGASRTLVDARLADALAAPLPPERRPKPDEKSEAKSEEAPATEEPQAEAGEDAAPASEPAAESADAPEAPAEES